MTNVNPGEAKGWSPQLGDAKRRRPQRLRPLHPAGLAKLPSTCPVCPLGCGVRPGEGASWARAAEAEWGSCGCAIHDEGGIIGYLLLCPPLHLPRGGPQSGGGLSPDAAIVMSVRVVDAYAGNGLGRQLVQAAAAQITRAGGRQFGALEVRGTTAAPSCGLPPVGFLQATGFQPITEHPLTPRLRMELSRTVRRRPRLPAFGRIQDLVRQAPPEPASRVHRQAK